jgi:hypothetical protein
MEKRAIYQPSIIDSPLRQGEILSNVIQYKLDPSTLSPEDTESSLAQQILHSYAIIVTQDCDLDWDYRSRKSDRPQPSKLLNSVILCEVAMAEEVRYSSDNNMNRKEWELVTAQRHERFYFFEKIPVECELEQIGLPELTADFKKVFGIDSATLYRQIELGMAKRRALLSSPYLEHFSRRYHNFHGRVALPHQYESAKEG